MKLRQGGVTVVTPITAGREEALTGLLDGIGHNDPANPHLQPSRLPTVHSLRWVVLAGRDGMAASLVLASDFDCGPEDDREVVHLAELVRGLGSLCDAVYEHCEGYPAPGTRNEATVVAYLSAHRVAARVSYVGALGCSLDDILREETLRQELTAYLRRRTKRRMVANEDPLAIRREIQAHLRRDDAFAWAVKQPPPRLAWYVRYGTRPLFLAAERVQRALERRPTLEQQPVLPAGELTRYEDVHLQNQFSHIVDVKPGRLRPLILKLMLRLIDFRVRTEYVDGSLGGVSSIHFARWVLLDEDRLDGDRRLFRLFFCRRRLFRLFFYSTYDGSWERYFDAFIDKAAPGLNAIWSNTEGYPRTRFLLWRGARDGARFKRWAREGQVATQVWYSAYPDLWLDRIRANAAVRAGLSGDMTAEEARQWLGRL